MAKRRLNPQAQRPRWADIAASTGRITLRDPTPFQVNGTTPIPARRPMFDTVNFKAPFDAGGGTPQNTYDLVGRVDYQPHRQDPDVFPRRPRELHSAPRIRHLQRLSPIRHRHHISESELSLQFSHIFTPSLFLSTKASYTRFNENTSFDTTLL